MRIRLLGGFRVSVGSRTIEGDEWRLRKAASLVKLLTLAPNHRLHREQVMDLLWPDLGRQAASNNLRKTLHAARRTLDPDAGSRYLASEDESLVLCAGGGLWIDVEAFEEAAATARRARDPAAYRAAIELYTGDLLPEARYEEWVENRRENLRQLYLALLIELAGLYEERDEPGLAIEELRKATAKEPTLEEAHTGLMRLHAFSGRPEQAIAQYERLRDALSRGLGTEPEAATRRLREDIATGRLPPVQPAAPPPKGPSDVDKHNLPAARTNFVGREREMVEVKRTLAMTRLLTLTGTGGCGKTRLALEVARELVGIYPDGVWLVELAPLSEGALVPKAVAEALGVPERPQEPLADTLADVLRGREVLLILDNCEHLLEPTARLVDKVLDSCPRLRILATSREGLGVEGEIRRPVPPLSTPEQERMPSIGELEGYESVRLFVERTRGRVPSFSLSPHNALAVAEICRMLEGIPLAIELAAARMGTLSLEQISKRLEGSLEFLTHGGRTAVPRQRTLKGALEWSYDLLLEAERVLFGRLSTFAGGWTLEAAEAVGSGKGVTEGEVLDLLSGLVEKSLIVAPPIKQGGVRYRLLEPVRQYALKKLEQSDEFEAIRRSHAEYFLALAEEAEPQLNGPREAEWFERLEEEHDNIRAALSWALARGDPDQLGLRLAGALRAFWLHRRYYSEGRGWLEEALAKEGGASPGARLKALDAAGHVARRQGDLDRAKAAAEEGLKLSAEAGLGSDHDVASFTTMLAYLSLNRGDLEQATKLAEESLAISRQANDAQRIEDTILLLGGQPHAPFLSLLILGEASRARGDYEKAKEFYEEGLVHSRELDSAYLISIVLSNLGRACLFQGDLEQATALSEEAAALTREGVHRGRLEEPLYTLGWVALLGGDLEQAKALHKESLALCHELGDKAFASNRLAGLACVAGAEGEVLRAARLFGAAEASCEDTGIPLEPAERSLVEPYLVGARSQLEEGAWAKAWEEGQAMSMEEAIEYALPEEQLATTASPTPGQVSAHKPPTLTPREEEVATLVARGLTNRQIASEISVSEHTVANHVAKILRKLGFESRSQITAWVIEQRISP